MIRSKPPATKVPGAPESAGGSAPRQRRWLLALLALAVLATPGCGGCQPETPQQKAAREQRDAEEAEKRRKEREAKKKPPPLVIGEPAPQPNQGDSPLKLVKPGHWMAATQSMKANNENWVGEATLQVVDRQNQLIPVKNTAFGVRSQRDVALAKGEPKQVESVFYVPVGEEKLSSRTTLRERGTSLAAPPANMTLERMRPHQHHLVVLAAEPRRYDFVRSLFCVNEPFSSDFDLPTNFRPTDPRWQYQVVAPVVDQELLLPDNPLCLTSVAYIVWDEIDPEQLSAGQRDAIIDWLHWGGQLLISGPDSLDLLRGSFLDPYLPADSEGGRTITTDDLKKISAAWAVGRRPSPLKAVADWSGLKLKLRPEAEPMAATGDLVAERRVGRGRVLVTAMQLAERDLVNWAGGFQNFFNSLMLRRAPRQFAKNETTFIGEDDDGSSLDTLYVVRPKRSGALIPADGNSKVRYFARDTHRDPAALSYRVDFASDTSLQQYDSPKLEPPAVQGGVASWNDFSATANAARGVLREAAGVSVPGSDFVMTCLGIYLAVLGPFNWFFFRAMGRVELAWVAAPVIALLGTWVVVKQAQLDIGFVRAQTEVAILELQPDHRRGCLTRYLSLYTSLSTTYDLEFEERSAVAAPFARSSESPLRSGEAPALVTYNRQEKARLRGLLVSSNSTDMAHAEQMLDLGGALRYDAKRRQLTNETDLEFTALAVVRRRTVAQELEGCWVGDLRGRSSTPVSFSPLSFSDEAPLFGEERAAEAEGEGKERLNFEALFQLALKPRHFEPGEVRAVAYLDKVFPGVTVTPKASQLRGGTLVVAHLKYGPLPAPTRDKNNPVEVMARR
ncbi:MAG: hypothetical protein AAF589_04610 [Planctomycetota bacterium]